MNRSRLYFAVTIALVAALPLAGCGRKGPLDPPPGGMALQSGSLRTPVTSRGLAPSQVQQQQDFDEDGRPVAPEGPKQRHPLDWLLN